MVQDLFHESKVLQASLAHLVVHMGWAHAKNLKETNPYPSNHTFVQYVTQTWFMFKIIKYINWAHRKVGLSWIGFVENMSWKVVSLIYGWVI